MESTKPPTSPTPNPAKHLQRGAVRVGLLSDGLDPFSGSELHKRNDSNPDVDCRLVDNVSSPTKVGFPRPRVSFYGISGPAHRGSYFKSIN